MYVDVDTYRFTVNEYIILDPDTIIFTVYVDIAKKQIYNEPKHTVDPATIVITVQYTVGWVNLYQKF